MQRRVVAAAWLPCLRAARSSGSGAVATPARLHIAEGWRQASTSSNDNGHGASSQSAAPTASPGKPRAGSTSTSPAVDRTRSKLPTAKAKAQASRALRQQLQAASARPGHANLTGNKSDQDARQPSDQINPTAGSASHFQPHGAPSSTITPAAEESKGAPPLLQEVVAWATADSYDFGALIRSGRLPAGWTLLEDDEAIHIPSWPPHSHASPHGASTSVAHAPPSALSPTSGTGEVFIFSSGAYVTWGLSEDQSHRFLRSVIRGRTAMGKGKARAADADLQVEHEKYHHIGDEGMEWVWRADEPTRIVGDVIVLGHAPHSQNGADVSSEVDPAASTAAPASANSSSAATEDVDWTPMQARLAYSQGLARSARLSAQEEALDMFLSSVNSIPEQLEAAGEVPLPRKEVIRKMGTLLRLRQRANLGKDNFLDDPEGHWDNGSMEYHYDEICRSLDIEPRFRALNEKLDHGENLLGVIRALLTERSSHRMELIIIYLIALEATLAIISHDYVPTPRRVYRLLTGKDWSESSNAAASPDSSSHLTDAHAAAAASPETAPAGPENVEIGLTIGLLRRALSLLDLQGDDDSSPAAALSPTSATQYSPRVPSSPPVRLV